jgi:RNA-directed DNA polymerase
MMNERGKSDRPIVPGKSPNKARTSAAEEMEGRGLAKGNPSQQNASRTPSRIDAPSALERVRQAAKKDKKLRFTALLHHIYNPEAARCWRTQACFSWITKEKGYMVSLRIS